MRATATDTIQVDVYMVGNAPKKLSLPEDTTVREALVKAGYETATEVFYKGQKVDLDSVLEDGDEITVMQNKIKQGA